MKNPNNGAAKQQGPDRGKLDGDRSMVKESGSMKRIVIGMLLCFAVPTPMTAHADPSSDCASDKDFHFGTVNFKNEVWLADAHFFKNPIEMNVEFISSGAFSFRVVDMDGKVVIDDRRENEHGGWIGIHFPSQGMAGGRFKLGFANASEGEKKIKQGHISCK